MAPAVTSPEEGVWQIATPSRPSRIPGVTMAGFRQQAIDPIDLEIVPFPAITISVDLGPRQPQLEDLAGAHQRGSVVVGLAPDGVRVRGREIECLQIRISPVLAGPVLGGTTECEGAILALDDMWGRGAVRFEELLRSVRSWDERFTIVDDHLVRRLATHRGADPVLAFVWGEMVSSAGQTRVEELATEIGWSRQRLWSRFRAQLGIGPKRAAQLIRFDEAAHRLAAGHGPAHVAAATGYVDQSHLHREAMAFTGKTPSAIAAAAWLSVDDIAWPGSAHRAAT